MQIGQPRATVGNCEGYVWKSKSGQYCWEVRNDEMALAGGGGHDQEADALEVMQEALAELGAETIH